MSIFRKAAAAATALLLTLSLAPSSVFPSSAAAAAEQPLAALMFASDYQPASANSDALSTFGTAANIATKATPGKKINSLIMCGDYTNINGQSNYNGDAAKAQNAVNEIKNCFKMINRKTTASYHFLQGNHDAFDESFMDATGAQEYENYILYILNTEDANPWQQGTVGAEQTVKAASAKLKAYLDEKVKDGENRPVIIATHVPLHFSGRTSSLYHGGVGDNMYSSYFFNAINEAAKDLNIFFVFGHNHSNGWDSYIGGGSVYKRPGDTLLIPSCADGGTSTDTFTEETLNFTYMNAGYVGHFSNYPTGSDTAFTVSVMEIYEDNIVISRYDSLGSHCLSAAGVYNEHYDDSGLINDQHFSTELTGPDTVTRIKHEAIIILGDIDGDNALTPADTLAMRKYLARIFVDDDIIVSRADVNNDGIINAKDQLLMRKALLQ